MNLSNNYITNNLIGKSALEILLAEFFIVYLYGALFFYTIENPAINFGNFIIQNFNLNLFKISENRIKY